MEVLKALPEHVLQYLCITLEYVVEDVQGDGLQSSLFLVQVKELLEFDSVSIVADQALELVGDDDLVARVNGGSRVRLFTEV